MIASFDSANVLAVVVCATMILWIVGVVIINVWSIFKK